MSETSCIVTTNRPGATRLGSVGQPIEGMELWIADDGELLVRGPLVMAGYRNRPDLTAAGDRRRRLAAHRRHRAHRRRRLRVDRRPQEGADHQRGRQEHVAGQHRGAPEELGPAHRPGLRRRRPPALQRGAARARPRRRRRPRSRRPGRRRAGAGRGRRGQRAPVARGADQALPPPAGRVAARRRRADADDEAQAPADRREVRRRDRRASTPRLPVRHGRTPTARPPARAGGQRPLRDRLRQRRLVDLLRARPGRVVRARPDAGRLHHHRLHLLPDGRHLRRGDGDVPGGRRLVVVRAARLQRVRVLLRRLGADAQLHDHDRHLGVLRAALLRQRDRRRRAAPQPGRHLLRHRRRRRAQPGQRRGRQGVGGRQRPAGRHRLPHPAAARPRRDRARLLARAR